MKIPPFTLDGYRETVSGILDRGYEIRSFHDVVATKKHLVLRHDVDQSIQIARELAEVEAERGWHSTWFILVRTNMYNPFSKENVADLRHMMSLGHEIGLHLDATNYGDEAALQDGAAMECGMLEGCLGEPVKLISFHRPAKNLLNSDARIAGRLHTYMPRFMTEMGYSSDSRGEWRHGHIWQHGNFDGGRALQFLSHAIWWVGPPGVNARDRLLQCLKRAETTIVAELEANSEVWTRPS